MRRYIFIFKVLVVVLFASMASAEKDYSEVEIKVVPVSGSVYMLEGSGGNIGVSVGSDGILMVDDQFEPLAGKIREALKKLGQEKPQFILNTHWHRDHTSGNIVFGAEGIIIAHDHVRERLASRQENKFFGFVSEPKPKKALPVITFKDSLSVHFNDEAIDVLHLPKGHTDGDSVVFFRGSNVVHTGDLMFNGMYPFVDLESGGNVAGYMNNVGILLEQIPIDAKIIPGHGPVGTWKDLKSFHEMLLLTTGIIREAMKEGRRLEEIQASGFSDDIQNKWGQGFLSTDKWISIIYNSYQ